MIQLTWRGSGRWFSRPATKTSNFTAVLKQIINQEDSSKAAPKVAEASNASPKARIPSPPGLGTGGKNILSSDVEIKGKLRFSNELIIDGRIEGEVNSEGDLTVGENATIIGDIRTRSVLVYGRIEGNITVTDRCELKQNAALHGDVVAGKLAIEEGATFMGTSTVGAPKSAAGAAPVSADGL
ncbi:MAG: polymer-forming cytoskeletal protein [Verrucomicrobia bacterium]|jgi:cytoskeletal protein CcmA (bactofilin family)|nr:polymer-forming cytoskeletal protein [Verrucomicrobiota bacterium]